MGGLDLLSLSIFDVDLVCTLRNISWSPSPPRPSPCPRCSSPSLCRSTPRRRARSTERRALDAQSEMTRSRSKVEIVLNTLFSDKLQVRSPFVD